MLRYGLFWPQVREQEAERSTQPHFLALNARRKSFNPELVKLSLLSRTRTHMVPSGWSWERLSSNSSKVSALQVSRESSRKQNQTKSRLTRPVACPCTRQSVDPALVV